MKNVALIFMLIIVFTGCKQNTKEAEHRETQVSTTVISPSDSAVVNVYYFHGRQRCKTCIAVGNVAKETIEKNFAENDKVYFTEIDTSDEANEALVEKYEIAWNALIIIKGDHSKDITEQAFAFAVDSPEKLSDEIISIVKSL